MATVINNPGPERDSGSGYLLGIVLLIVFVFILLWVGLPALRNATPSQPGQTDVQVDVPEQVDVNVQEGGQ